MKKKLIILLSILAAIIVLILVLVLLALGAPLKDSYTVADAAETDSPCSSAGAMPNSMATLIRRARDFTNNLFIFIRPNLRI